MGWGFIGLHDSGVICIRRVLGDSGDSPATTIACMHCDGVYNQSLDLEER